LMNKYHGNFSMAAAAYNAGPHRVRQWRPTANCLASDIWIDSIPFRETRRYVRTALFYYVIYQHRLGREIKPLESLLMDVPPNGRSSCTK
ncbi:MAG: transglycosylase SLT domain-containing protein, partial [Gammaproteobacteria bacterium]